MDMITGDGGFDFSLDFNNQERDMSKLLFGQIAYALSMQKLGGSFILKIFDCFMPHTMDMLALLSSFYAKVYITKPQTSRYANSEKYVVCKGFLHSTSHAFAAILRQTMVDMLTHDRTSTVNVCRFLSVPLSMTFVLRMEEYNAIFGQQQIENIHYTLSLMENKNRDEKIDGLIKTNVQRSVNWCIKYNVPYQAGVVEPFLRK
jgi:cap1 methyltransferase